MKKSISLVLIASMLMTLFIGCAQETEANAPISNLSTTTAVTISQTTTISQKEQQKKEDFAKSTAENDTDVGLKNIKVDTAQDNLTDSQRAVLNYFDNDYMTVPSYEFLQRYPNVYKDTNLHLDGKVSKILSADGETFEMLLQVVNESFQYYANNYPLDSAWYYEENNPEEYQNYLRENASALVFVTGELGDVWFLEGDHIEIYGKYIGISTKEIDGQSYTIPTIEANSTYIWSEYQYSDSDRYTLKDIKQVAEAIFGKNIEIREPMYGEDMEGAQSGGYEDKKFFVVEPENQSNAKFSKYRFYTQFGEIEDAKTGTDWWLLGTNPNIQRVLEFSSDFEHFILLTFDYSLEQLTLEYYSSEFIKLWEREFDETVSATYDFTKNSIYLCANNELYIVNTETGEDTFMPSFVGAKQELRKLSDGILLVGSEKSDAIIKVILDGTMIWKTNLLEDVMTVSGIQLVEDNVVMQLELTDGMHFVVLDNSTGEIQIDAVSMK